MSLYLTDEEMREISGKTAPAAVRRYFAKNGYTFHPKGNGMPLITTDYFQRVANGTEVQKQQSATVITPDASEFIRAMRKKSTIAA